MIYGVNNMNFYFFNFQKYALRIDILLMSSYNHLRIAFLHSTASLE